MARGHSQQESAETAVLETRLPLRGNGPLASLPGTVVLPAHRMAAAPTATTEFWTVSPCFYGFPHSVPLLLVTVNYKVSFSLPRKLRLPGGGVKQLAQGKEPVGHPCTNPNWYLQSLCTLQLVAPSREVAKFLWVYESQVPSCQDSEDPGGSLGIECLKLVASRAEWG